MSVERRAKRSGKQAVRRFNFTKRSIEALAAERGRYYVRDTKVRGLTIDILPSGAKVFRLYRKISGKPERITLGRFPDLAVERARALAESANAAIAEGKNPAAKRREINSEMTLAEMFGLYMQLHATKHKRSASGDEWLFQRYLNRWHVRKLSSITRSDVERLHTAVGATHGKYAANRVLSLLSVLYNKAIAWGWDGAKNPAKDVKRFPEVERERFLHADELPRFFEALKVELDTDARDAILIMLLTGARKMNVLSMRWQDVHLERAVWTIPLTKSGNSQNVPLVPFAVELVRARESRRNGSEYVFPGRHGNGHRIEIKSAWERVRQGAGVPDVRLHDLRRTLGSWQAASGTSLHVIGKTLGHSDVNTTAIYARLDLDPVRQAVNTATQMMLTAGGMANG